MSSNYPPGVSDRHPHFHPPEPSCEYCGVKDEELFEVYRIGDEHRLSLEYCGDCRADQMGNEIYGVNRWVVRLAGNRTTLWVKEMTL